MREPFEPIRDLFSGGTHMQRRLLLGIDVGTTSLKALICDAEGQILAEAGREYATTYPRPNWAEQDPEDWWRAACATVSQIIAEARIDPRGIAGIGISSQAPSVVPVDEAGEVLHPALIWMDRRSEAQCTRLRNRIDGKTVADINGGRIDPYYLAPKLLWLKEHEPDCYRRTSAVLQANGYLVHRLCGTCCMDASIGPLTLFFDSRQQCYSEHLADLMGLDLAKMPRLARCTDVVGGVTTSAAAAIGLIPGTPVVAGACDGTAASVEAGLLVPGDAVEMTGQSTVLMICSDRPYLGEDLIPLGHALPDRHLVVGAMVASGGALRWFRDQLGEVEREAGRLLGVDPFELLSAEASRSPAGANRLIFLPYMFGERSPIWDTSARGVFFGLSLATRKADMVRAVMEGAALGLRHNLETAAASGFRANGLSCVGGGARSRVWNQIKADVLQMPVRVPRAPTGAPLGDAIIAGVGVGLYPSFEAAVQRVVQAEQTYVPDSTQRQLYDGLFRVYTGLYPALKLSFYDLGRVMAG
jgi:xylulokinase